MKVIGCGYRDWSLNVFEDVSKIDGIDLVVKNSKDQVTQEIIETIKPDVILFYGWSWIIPSAIINKYMCLCLHPSPLPRYRGGSPIQHQILAGKKASAVSIFKMTEKLDAGSLCYVEEFSLEGKISDIFCRIEGIAKKATRKILENIMSKNLVFTPQPDGDWPVYKRRKPQESEITIEEIKKFSAKKLYDKIRMLTDPYPNAYLTCSDGKKLFITDAKYEKEK